LSDVVKLTVFIKEGTPTGPLNEVWKQRFTEPRPPRSSLFVSHLKNPEMLVEIEAIAVVD